MTEYTQLSEREQKELLFNIIQRLQYIPEFFSEIKNLSNKYPSPTINKNHTNILKTEYNHVE
jgi:hypothetical protein